MTEVVKIKKKGGIQPGTVASSVESKLIDKQVNTANKELFQELKDTIPGLTYQAKLQKNQIASLTPFGIPKPSTPGS